MFFIYRIFYLACVTFYFGIKRFFFVIHKIFTLKSRKKQRRDGGDKCMSCFTGWEGILGCLLHWSPKFCINDFLFIGIITLGNALAHKYSTHYHAQLGLPDKVRSIKGEWMLYIVIISRGVCFRVRVEI